VNKFWVSLIVGLLLLSCNTSQEKYLSNPQLSIKPYEPKKSDLKVSREMYFEKFKGFWLGQNIGNWTGLVTEMDKIGNIGAIKTGPFYTRDDWGKPDLPNIWSEGIPSNLSPTIDFVFRNPGEVWGADDDTDIEYLYQHLLYENKTSFLSPEMIRDGWLKHILREEENYLWVSNQRAFDLMQQGMLPPETGHPENNQDFDMIDAQLTTEIFGLFAPARNDIARKMARLPIQTTARFDSEYIAQFYVTMHALAITWNDKSDLGEHLLWISEIARNEIPDSSYASKMYDFVRSNYESGISWEETRDLVYQRYQVDQEDGYDISSREMHCNGCFAAGINFAASLISLFYGKGDIIQTIKLGVLMGWDSDNPTATWGGLLGFMLGQKGVEAAFQRKFSETFNIHRTRQNFGGNGLDNFSAMARKGIHVTDRVVQEIMGGGIDIKNEVWYIPDPNLRRR
jgi:hypothetical protein